MSPGTAPGPDRDLRSDLLAVAETDETLERLARRRPTGEDLNDPLLATLAVLAAEVDLDQVPTRTTRLALQRGGLWPPRPAADSQVPAAPVDIAVPLVEPRARRRPPVTPAPGPMGAGAAPAAFTEPWAKHALQAASGVPGPPRVATVLGEPARGLGLRLLPAVAASAAAVVLSMGAAAALTGGRSVNPAAAVERIVQQITDRSGDRQAPAVRSPGGSSGATDPSAGALIGSPGALTGSPSAGGEPAPDAGASPVPRVQPTGEPASEVAPTDVPADPTSTTTAPAGSTTSSSTHPKGGPPPHPTKPEKAPKTTGPPARGTAP